MGELRNLMTPLHQASRRDYVARMLDNKVEAMTVAKRYDKDYWDGSRRYGYGGYNYIPGRWKPVAQELIQIYGLSNDSAVLDIGCGKAFLLYEMQLLLPGARLFGIDRSAHALAASHPDFRGQLMEAEAQRPLTFADCEFDLVISLATLHNLRIFELEVALAEIERVGRQAYVMVESYRTAQELFNLECWALTIESFFDDDEWRWLFSRFNYSGDYEFIYFE